MAQQPYYTPAGGASQPVYVAPGQAPEHPAKAPPRRRPRTRRKM